MPDTNGGLAGAAWIWSTGHDLLLDPAGGLVSSVGLPNRPAHFLILLSALPSKRLLQGQSRNLSHELSPAAAADPACLRIQTTLRSHLQAGGHANISWATRAPAGAGLADVVALDVHRYRNHPNVQLRVIPHLVPDEQPN